MTLYDIIQTVNSMCGSNLHPYRTEIKDARSELEKQLSEAKMKVEQTNEAINFLKCFKERS